MSVLLQNPHPAIACGGDYVEPLELAADPAADLDEPPPDDDEKPLSAETRRRIERADWDDLVRRLLAYALFRLSRLGWTATRLGSKADDYVQTAVSLLLEGTRRFPENTSITLFAFLCGVIDSLISHDAEKLSKRPKEMAIEVEDENDDSAYAEVTEERLPAPDNFEEEILLKDHLEKFANAVGPDLGRYVWLRAKNEGATAEEHARVLGVTISDIRNWDKQLSRRRGLYECISRRDYRVCGRARAKATGYRARAKR